MFQHRQFRYTRAGVQEALPYLITHRRQDVPERFRYNKDKKDFMAKYKLSIVPDIDRPDEFDPNVHQLNERADGSGRVVVVDEDTAELVSRLWKNPQTGAFRGARPLWEWMKKRYLGVALSEVEAALRNEETAQVHKQPKRIPVTQPIVAKRPLERWQVDLAEMPHPGSNGNKRYLLTVVDIFTKKARVAALRRKEAADVAEAFEGLIAEVHPSLVQSDNGGEFKGEFAALLERWGIRQVFSASYRPTTQAHVERFNGTIKRKLGDYMSENDTKRWIDALDDLVSAYNDTVHSTIRKTPNQAENDNVVGMSRTLERLGAAADKSLERYGGKSVPVLAAGDKVRVARRTEPEVRREMAGLGRKSTAEQWSRQIYVVSSVSRPRQKPGRREVRTNNEQYRLIGESKIYRRHDLQKVDQLAVVARRGRLPRPRRYQRPDDDSDQSGDDGDQSEDDEPQQRRRPRRGAADAAQARNLALGMMGYGR